MTNKTLAGNFTSLSKALESGDHEAIEKIMAEEEAPEQEEEELKEEQEVLPEEKEEEEEEVSEPSEKDSEKSGEEEEEAASAASTADEEKETPAEKTAREIELEKELQRLRSDAGRVPYIQRRMAELEREVRAYKARESQTTQGKAKPTDVELDEDTRKEIEALREVDPVMARTLERIAKAAISTAASKVDNVVTTFTQAEQEEDDYKFLMEQKSILVEKIPQADDIFASNEWREWKETLTPNQRAFAESSYAVEVEQAIYAFAAAMQAKQGAVQTNTAPPATAAPPEPSKVSEARERKTKAAAGVSAPAARKAVELDPDDYFKEMYKQIGKSSHILKD